MKHAFAVLLLAIVFGAVVTVVALTDGGTTPGKPRFPLVRATPPAPTATPPLGPTFTMFTSDGPLPTPSAIQPTPPPVLGPPFVRPTTVPPGPGRDGNEATLVEVATGRSLRLWTPGNQVWQAVFSDDSHYLVYDSGGDYDRRIYRVDLAAQSLRAMLLSDGAAPIYSSRGDLVFATTREDSTRTADYDIHVYTHDGRLITLKEPGSGSYVWSKSGRWLTYQRLAIADFGQAAPTIRHYVFDVETGDQTQVEKTYARSHGTRTVWSPVADQFIFGPVGGSYDAQFAVYDAPSRRTTMVPADAVWLPDGRIASQTAGTVGGAAQGFTLVTQHAGKDDATSWSGTLPYLVPASAWSPDGTKVFVQKQPGAGSFPPASIRPLTTASGGLILVYGIPAHYGLWSPDSNFLAWTDLNETASGCETSLMRLGPIVARTCITSTPPSATPFAFSPLSDAFAYITSKTLDGRRLDGPFLDARTNDVVVRDINTGQERTVFSDARGYLHCVQWSPDGRWLVVRTYCNEAE